MQQKESAAQPSVKPEVGLKETASTPKTFSEEEYNRGVRDARNAVLGEVGKLQKASAQAMETAKAAQEKVNQMFKEQSEQELAAARDDPQLLSVLQERQRRRQVESELV